MKSLFLCCVCWLFSPAAVWAQEPTWVAVYDGLLQKYVNADGVKYAQWHANSDDRENLRVVAVEIARSDLSVLNKEQQLAFYLNAYNALILHRILESYPVKGPGGGGLLGRNKFFKSKNLEVAGQKVSFSSLENEIIRPKFQEPRIHFALNCASKSCPPLLNRVFRAATLNADLEKLAAGFINGSGVKVKGREVNVSKIFQWYEEDFERGNFLAYLEKYSKAALPNNPKLTFQKYYWTLNEVK